MLNHALMCLATTIYMESAYQPIQAQVAVGYVLMRRADFNKDNINQTTISILMVWKSKATRTIASRIY
jgi:hypothetical protein